MSLFAAAKLKTKYSAIKKNLLTVTKLRARARTAAFDGKTVDFANLVKDHSKNPDGQITEDDWQTFVRTVCKMTIEDMDDSQVSATFRRLDKLHLGVLSLEQMVSFLDSDAAAKSDKSVNSSTSIDEKEKKQNKSSVPKATETKDDGQQIPPKQINSPNSQEEQQHEKTDDGSQETKEVEKQPIRLHNCTSITMLRRKLEAETRNRTARTDENVDEVEVDSSDIGPAIDGLSMNNEEGEETGWYGTVYNKERDRAYQLATMAAQLRAYETAISRTQKANDVLHRTLRTRDAARQEVKRSMDAAKEKGATDTSPLKPYKFDRASWRESFKFRNPDDAINDMAETAKREAAAAGTAAFKNASSSRFVSPQRTTMPTQTPRFDSLGT